MNEIKISEKDFWRIKCEIGAAYNIYYDYPMNKLLNYDKISINNYRPSYMADFYGWFIEFKTAEDKTNFILRWMD